MKRHLFAIICILLITGCAVTPYKDLNLDTTSNFNKPTEGNAGIYVYQWKTGIHGAYIDVDFEIKGLPVVSLNTGEYCSFEVPPGKYEYKLAGGLFKQYIPVEFEANENYFFVTSIRGVSILAGLERSQEKINKAKINIQTERYELCTID